ncbi:transmembrane protein 184C-like [Ylistrum balloti]|uniref:transmembrane protein 184C-like n=1 Tax=Ylistrum balloti TaxID=509963 RepID=UPI002905855F|nr:transmembrane protein 184C-like [Ylistrum balloti]
MDCIGQWKRWIRPGFIALYFILAIIALPLCIIELHSEGEPTHVQAWFAGGIFVMCAVPISLWGILQHLVNYTQPHLQRHIIRILWMVPIYALNAWFALRFPSAAIYLDTVRECYEAYVIYNFMAYLLNYLWEEHPQLDLVLRNKEQVRHLFPICWVTPWPMTGKFIDRCKHGALQYTVIRPVTTIIALICESFGKYDEGDFNFKTAWSYLVIVNNISQIWAMYCLVLFYKAMKEELAPIKPVPKFLCVKFVVFFSFWQSVIIAVLVEVDAIPSGGDWVFYDNINQVAAGLQDFCICVEMFLAAIAHYYSFSHKPFMDSNFEGQGWWQSFRSMWDVSDMRDDVVEHVRVIGHKVKKTVSKPLLRDRSERTPLLTESKNSYTQDSTSSLTNDPSDWDTASLETTSSLRPAFNPTDSMNNYVVFGSSSDQQEAAPKPGDQNGQEVIKSRNVEVHRSSNYTAETSDKAAEKEDTDNTDLMLVEDNQKTVANAMEPQDAQTDMYTDHSQDTQTDITTDQSQDAQTDMYTDHSQDTQTDITTDQSQDVQTGMSTDHSQDTQIDITTGQSQDVQTGTDHSQDTQIDITTGQSQTLQTDMSSNQSENIVSHTSISADQTRQQSHNVPSNQQDDNSSPLTVNA